MNTLFRNHTTGFRNLPEIKLFTEVSTSIQTHDRHLYDEENSTYIRLARFSDVVNNSAPRYIKRGLVLVDPTFEDLEFALPLYQHVAECERQVLTEVAPVPWCEWQSPLNKWPELQSFDESDDDSDVYSIDPSTYTSMYSDSTPSPAPSVVEGTSEDMDMWRTASAYFESLFPKSNAGNRLIRGVEAIFDFVIQLSQIYKSNLTFTSSMFFSCCRQFVRAITGRAILSMVHTMTSLIVDFCTIVTCMMQSEDAPVFNPFANVQKLFTSWELFKDHVLVQKLRTLMHHIVGMSLLPSWGVKFQQAFFCRAEQEAMRRTSNSKLGFIGSIIDTVTWIGERMINVYHTGDWNNFLLNGKDFSSWANSCYDVKLLSQQLYDPETCGFTYNEFVGKVDACLEKGEALLTHAKDVKSVDQKVMRRLLSEVKLLKADIMTAAAASQQRASPFATLLYGGSCLGKSSIISVLEAYMSRLFSLPLGDEYKYTRTFGEKHWNNFKSSCIYLTLDDISAKNANLEADLSMSEIISILNNIAFMPEQAALEGKGKTPFRGQFVTGTTNSKHLYAHVYYWSSLAIRRRFPLVTTVTVKKEFSQLVDGQVPAPYDRMLDSSKIPVCPPGEIPNLWEFKVEKIVAAPTQENSPQDAETRVVADNLDIFGWLQLMGKEATRHRQNQLAMLTSQKGYADIDVCKECLNVKQICTCNLFSESEEETSTDGGAQIQSLEFPIYAIGGLFTLYCAYLVKRWMESLVDRFGADMRLTMNTTTEQVRQDMINVVNDVTDHTPIVTGQVMQVVHDQLPILMQQLNYSAQAEMPRFFSHFDEHLGEILQGVSRQVQVTAGATAGEIADKIQFEIPALVGTAITSAKEQVFGGVRRTYNDVEHKIHTKKRQFRDWLDEIRSKYLPSFSQNENLEMERENVISRFWKIGEKVRSSVLPKALCVTIAIVPAFIGIRWIWAHMAKTQGTDEPGIRIDKKDEKPNPWFCDDYIPSALEVGKKSISWKALESGDVCKRILGNIDYALAMYSKEGKLVGRKSRLLALGGQLYVTTNHCIPEEGQVHIEITSMSRATQIGRNASVVLGQSDFVRLPERDLVFFLLKNLPPRADMMDCIPSETFKCEAPGYFLSRCEDGSERCDAVKSVRRIERYIHQLDKTISSWAYNLPTNTVNGDCGSVIMAQTHFGPQIVALHQMEQNFLHNASGPMLTKEIISKVREVMGAKISTLQSNAPILLDARDAQIHLQPLHYKSPFRYIQEGTATVYGSIPVARSSFKSDVVDTAIRTAVEKRGYVCDVGAPCLRGWEPWSHAIKDIVQQKFVADQQTIDQCVESFSDEILANLPADQLGDICVLEDLAVVNGLPGVRFIDKMKRNTSMGFPYNKKKSFFLTKPQPFDIWQDCVDFDDKFYSRVQTIIDRYRSGDRHMPVFTGHLKDEAMKLVKILAKKTRVFLIGPSDWAFVVRKYLLGFVRVVQNNKYVFEAAPGTNATSPEWETMYKYLTHFGEDNMVAGDFSKFDKRMSAQWILAAFQVIEKLWRRSPHWKEEYSNIIRGIASDTAFPLCIMNGDLVQFWGSNPSGHPLTVIINSLVNSLYMRYAWVKSGHDLCAFKKHVHLMTYGDDNVMGIDKNVPTFDHTVIQERLAEIGVVYTMADKERESIPRINISEISFLKRFWRWEPELQQHVAQLEEASLAKSDRKSVV